MGKQVLYIICYVVCVFTALCINTGCIKEYSFEGRLIDTTATPDTTVTDTVVKPVVAFPVCTACINNSLPVQQWSFISNEDTLCGTLSGAVINYSKDAFTFFGPSACSEDTGLVITAYFTQKLDADKYTITTNKVSFVYYDNATPSRILKSWIPQEFLLTIDKYEHATRNAVGTFSGYAFTEAGAGTLISNGKFNIILR